MAAGNEEGAEELLAVADEEDEEVTVKGWRSDRRKRAAQLIGTPLQTTFSKSMSCKSTCRYALCTVMAMLVAAILSLAVGLFVGQSLGRKAVDTTCTPSTSPPAPQGPGYDWGDVVNVAGKTESVSDYFSSHLSEDDIKRYLANLTASPHIAGSDSNRNLAKMMYNEWTGYDFDSVDLLNYTVLLSYPNASNPNRLTLKEASGQLLYQSHIAQEPPLNPEENNSNVVPPFNAYSGSGNVTGPLVYVNYGSIGDFQYLTNITGLNLSSFICMARYGKLYRGDKANLAERFGCKGLLIYSDPYDYAPEGTPVYPDGPGLPPYGIQRGSLQRSIGDILTPGVPAIAGVHPRSYAAVQASGEVPHIPVQPISYGDAIHFMSQLSDHTPPAAWMGGLQIEYKIAQSAQNNNYTELVVNNYQEHRLIQNVVAKLYGGVEPDRQVVLGNHRDAWVFGAVDPSSGTAALMNLAKVIGQLRQFHDWRPGRTLVLCSWDAEEYGLIGSTEWVEDYGKVLGASTMAYLNVDVAVTGSAHFSASASPLMYEVLWQAAGMVQCPNEGFDSIYDEWLNTTGKMYKGGVYRPFIYNLGSGSDYAGFMQLQGVSSTSMSYTGSHYGVYHSVHDNFYWMSQFGDPPFTHHRATATVWIMAALLLTTTPLPPIDPSHYSYLLVGETMQLSDKYGETLNNHGISLDLLVHSVFELESVIQQFQERVMNMSSSTNISQHLNLVRIINDKLMNFERAFIHPEGLPGRPYMKHVIFAPSSVNSYDSSVFPGLSDAITNATASEGGWEEVKRQLDVVATHVRHATQIIAEPSLEYALNVG